MILQTFAVFDASEVSGTGASAAIELPEGASSVDLILTVPSVDVSVTVKIQSSRSAAGPWKDSGSQVVATSANEYQANAGGLYRFVRLHYTVAPDPEADLGDPATVATLTASLDAWLVYASPADMRARKVGAKALVGQTDAELDVFLRDSTELMNTYFRPRFQIPFLAWGSDIRRKCVEIAQWNALADRGFNPENAQDAAVKVTHDLAIKWLEGVVSKGLTPSIADAASISDTGTVAISSDTPRTQSAWDGGDGWND